MEKTTITYTTINQYIAGFPKEIQSILKKLRKVIKDAAPDAQERISYRMPAFYLKGNLVYFAAFKKHIGFYPTASGIAAFKKEISAFNNSKGAVQFPVDKPLPYDLIRKIVEFRVLENLKKANESLCGSATLREIC